MADVARIPRRRGGLCGLLLIVLGAWGGLAPFIGPYFKFAFTPDKAWQYTSGRLYLSILPGAAALLGGLIVVATRNRGAGMLGGLLAAIGGAWFIVGSAIVGTVLHRSSISPGLPVVHLNSVIPSATWGFLEELGFFVGVGILIIFFGALATGRFSLLSARDAAVADDDDFDDFPSSGDQATTTPASSQFPATTTGQFPAASQFPASPRPFPGDEPTGQFPAATGQFPTSTGQFPKSTGPFPSSPSGTYPETKP
jgi:hypothetical protein